MSGRIKYSRKATIKKEEKELKVGVTHNCFRTGIDNSLGLKTIFINSESDLKDLDLVIFPGGEDIDPRLYGEPDRYCGGINPQRDEKEHRIFNYIQCTTSIRNKIKILGICRGHQLINVLLGGRLLQDMHFQEKINHPGAHPLKMLSSGFVNVFTNSTVNSLHHQAVIKYGSSLMPTSFYCKTRDDDYIFESCESKNIVTVQFHPEILSSPECVLFWEKIKSWASGKKEESKQEEKSVDISNNVTAKISIDNSWLYTSPLSSAYRTVSPIDVRIDYQESATTARDSSEENRRRREHLISVMNSVSAHPEENDEENDNDEENFDDDVEEDNDETYG